MLNQFQNFVELTEFLVFIEFLEFQLLHTKPRLGMEIIMKFQYKLSRVLLLLRLDTNY